MGRRKTLTGSEAPRAEGELEAGGGADASVEAAVLCDFHHEGKKIPAGTVFTADAKTVKSYVAAGVLDTHPALVAHAKAQG